MNRLISKSPARPARVQPHPWPPRPCRLQAFPLAWFAPFVSSPLNPLASPIPATFRRATIGQDTMGHSWDILGHLWDILVHEWDILGHFGALRWVEFHNLCAFLRQNRHFFTMSGRHPPGGWGIWDISRTIAVVFRGRAPLLGHRVLFGIPHECTAERCVSRPVGKRGGIGL
jgi:hypothetical protein